MKSERNSEIWKDCNTEKVQHEKSATRRQCNTKNVQSDNSELFFGNWIFDRYYHIFNIDIIYVNPCFQSMKFTFSTINSLKFWHWFSWYIYLLYFFFFLAIIFWKASIKIYVYSSIFPLFFTSIIFAFSLLSSEWYRFFLLFLCFLP